jgi:hypothetical protein
VIEKIIQFVNNLNKPKSYLILANVLMVFFLILLNNFKVIPLRIGDFVFFALLTLAFALYRPGWAFLFFIGTVALEKINLAPENLGIMIRPYQFIGALTIFAVVIRFFSKKLYFKLPRLEWFDYALLLVVFSGFLSIINAPNKIVSFKLSLIFATFFAFYYLVRIYIQNSEDLKRVVPFFISSGIVVIFYGIWQNWRFIHNLSGFETMPGRPNGTFVEADWLGIFLIFFISVLYTLIYYFVIAREHGDRSNLVLSKNKSIAAKLLHFARNDMILYILLILSYILSILTVSRSAWLGVLLATIVFLIAIFTDFKLYDWQWKKTIHIKLGIICSLIISLAIVYIFHLTNFQLFNRIQSTGTGMQKITISCYARNADPRSLPEEINNIAELEKYGCRHINLEDIEKEKLQGNSVMEVYRKDPNVQTRSEIYRKSWEQIKNHPLIGIGWGSINQVLGKDERGAGLNSSNIFLEIWLGAGIIGFLAFVIFWLFIIYNSIKNFYFRSDALQKTVFAFIIVSWFGLTIANLFNAGIMLGFLWVWLGIAAKEKA